MTGRILLVFITTVFFTACSTVPAKPPVAWAMKEQSNDDVKSREILIGRWYEETIGSDGTKMAELKELRRDGTYQITFRKILPNGHVSDQTEVGLWGVSGNIYFAILQGYLIQGTVISVPPTDADNYDAYEITKLDSQVFEIIHSATHQHFISKKVAKSFQLPDEI
jgi:hypothetical protein